MQNESLAHQHFLKEAPATTDVLDLTNHGKEKEVKHYPLPPISVSPVQVSRNEPLRRKTVPSDMCDQRRF